MKLINKKTRLVSIISLMLTSILIVTGCSSQSTVGDASDKSKKTIVLADAGWDSIRFHNDVASFIIENGYGYKTDVIPGTTAATFAGFRKGDIDAYMEIWTENIMDVYKEAVDSGDIIEVSTNFDDNAQGLYVPTYIIKGDQERGIKPLAPDLKTVKDLEKYPEIFKDNEVPDKGRIYGAPPGWSVDKVLQEKIKTYGLDKKYNYFSPGSDTALAASIASAYEKGEAWVGYYWEPTWITGKYDMTLLEDEKYSDEKWNNGYACEWPSQKVTVGVNKSLTQTAPDIVEFLKKYTTSSKLTGEALAYMMDKEVDTKEAAKWFLKEHEDMWTNWVTDEAASKVKEALK
jgi:glycine betaine/proline transport system substrate-binding protein